MLLFFMMLTNCYVSYRQLWRHWMTSTCLEQKEDLVLWSMPWLMTYSTARYTQMCTHNFPVSQLHHCILGLTGGLVCKMTPVRLRDFDVSAHKCCRGQWCPVSYPVAQVQMFWHFKFIIKEVLDEKVCGVRAVFKPDKQDSNLISERSLAFMET